MFHTATIGMPACFASPRMVCCGSEPDVGDHGARAGSTGQLATNHSRSTCTVVQTVYIRQFTVTVAVTSTFGTVPDTQTVLWLWVDNVGRQSTMSNDGQPTLPCGHCKPARRRSGAASPSLKYEEARGSVSPAGCDVSVTEPPPARLPHCRSTIDTAKALRHPDVSVPCSVRVRRNVVECVVGPRQLCVAWSGGPGPAAPGAPLAPARRTAHPHILLSLPAML